MCPMYFDTMNMPPANRNKMKNIALKQNIMRVWVGRTGKIENVLYKHTPNIVERAADERVI